MELSSGNYVEDGLSSGSVALVMRLVLIVSFSMVFNDAP
jgi:hypothetical protein